MCRLIVFVVFIVRFSVADNSADRCSKLLNPDVYRCCPVIPKSLKPLKMTFEDELKECFEIPMPIPTCEQAECVAKKKGYYAANGSFDREAYSNLLDKEFSFDADLLAVVKENCIEADISSYGPSTMCDFLKMRNCIHIQLLKNCPEWISNADCSEMSEIIEECIPLDI